MHKALWIVLLAFIVGGLASFSTESVPIDQRLISIRAQELMPDYDELADEPIELQAAVVDLGEDPLLLLKARAAMMVYPDMARTVFPLYASEPEFQRILRTHGEHVLPPIHFFLTHSVSTVEWMNKASVQYERAKRAFQRFRGKDVEDVKVDDDGEPLSPEERGWYAVNFIDREGQDFIGQFVVGAQGQTEWIQTERITEGVVQFFTGGIRQLEASYRVDGDVTASEIGWASVDMLVFASAVKVIRAGRVVGKTTQTARVSTRSAALAARVTGSARFLLRSARYAKWPAIIGVGYLVVSHPSLINDFFASAAELFDLPALAVQTLGWTLILVPVLYLFSWLLIPLLGLLKGSVSFVSWLAGRSRREMF